MITALKVEIERSGIKQKWLASRLGVSEAMLSRMISGDRKMPDTIKKQINKLIGARK